MDESDTEIQSMIRNERFAHISLTLINEKDILNKLKGLVKNLNWNPEDTDDLFFALLERFESMENDRSHLFSWMLEMLQCIEINYITPTWKCQMKKTLIESVQDQTLTNEDLKKLLADDTEKSLSEILEEIRQQKLKQIDEKLDSTNEELKKLLADDMEKQLSEILKKIRQQELNKIDEILHEVEDIVSSVNKSLDSHVDESQMSDMIKDLLKLCQAVEKIQSTEKKKFRPRLSQMVSWCIMALSKTGQLIQVGTGEGKSCIVAMFAAYQAMTGKKVDIMSSSPVLAERDLKEWQGFYKELDISVSCNCNKLDDDLKKCYESQVVYGTVEEFAGDWLRHHFQRKDIFGQRKCECAIVDEVDSLMLDKGLHVVYLSTDMPALHHLSPLLAFIWATVNKYSKVGRETTVGQKYPFHQVVLDALRNDKNVNEFTVLQMAEDLGLLAQGSVKSLRGNMSLLNKKTEQITTSQLAKFFSAVEVRFPSCQFALYCMNRDGAIEEVNRESQTERAERQRVSLVLINGGFCQYMHSKQAAEAEIKRALCFTPCDLSRDKRTCNVPGFLSDLVESKLKVWIENAFFAQTMSTDHEYVIEGHGVVPVDYSCTGVIENNMKWTDGLQQFLEMKHGSKLTDMTAITNYMSNVGMLQKYGDQIFGISGTLGQKTETETLQKVYKGIKTCQIPTFKRRKLFEVEGMIVDNDNEWIKKICDVVTAQINSTSFRSPRAALVICETISRAKDLRRALGEQVQSKKLYISNNMDNSAVFAQVEAGEVIIATNLAGRGTDLQVSESVKAAGGLFVVQTFLPKNARVEAQAFGRTARQGAPGSAQLIICSNHLSELLQLCIRVEELRSLLENLVTVTPVFRDLFLMQLRLYQRSQGGEQTRAMRSTLIHVLSANSHSKLNKLKEIREDSVAEELASFLEDDIPRIKKKDELFVQYLEVLDEVYKSKDNKLDDWYLSALNEFWGMWLLMNFNASTSITCLKDKLKEDLTTAGQKLSQRESPLSNLHHCTATGNELREKGHLAESIKMYTKAIEMDHCWAAVAYYNRAFTSLTEHNRNQDPNCIRQALEDLQNALKSVELYSEQNEVTERYSKQNAEDLSSGSVTRFNVHMLARKRAWKYFKTNIIEAIKKVDRADDLGGTVKVEESLVYFVVPAVDFLPLAILSTLSVSEIRSRDPLKIQQLISHPSFDILSELRCLESLGLTHVYTLDTMFTLGGFVSKIKRKVFD